MLTKLSQYTFGGMEQLTRESTFSPEELGFGKKPIALFLQVPFYDRSKDAIAISMIDQEDKPARTMLTSEGGFSRTTHIVKDKMTGRVRLLTATEAERIQGFPTDHTKYCLVNNETVEMPLRKRRFMMGNALVVNLVEDMEKTLDQIFENE